MAKTLVKGGTTPTGFGIRQHSSGGLRATSPCCNRSMDFATTDTIKCRGCAETFPTIPMWNLTGEVLVSQDVVEFALDVDQKFSTINWAREVTGYPALTMDVKF